MNIFETINSVSERDEPYHSQFLADALNESLTGDRSLFERVWKLTAREDWQAPDNAEITSEEILGDRSRIDICIKCEEPYPRVVGIEIKTADASAKAGQLQGYQQGLARKYRNHTIQIAYLTPFTQKQVEQVGAPEDRTAANRVFNAYQEANPEAKHVSWLDIADIDWDGRDLWKQHQVYVRNHISDLSQLEETPERRELSKFFGEEATECFRGALAESGVQLGAGGTLIELARFERDLPSFTWNLLRALNCLLSSTNVPKEGIDQLDEFPEHLRSEYLNSRYGEVHAALFGLAKRFGHVWIKGGGNYGVRTAHKNHRSSGVSLLTAYGPDRIEIGRRR